MTLNQKSMKNFGVRKFLVQIWVNRLAGKVCLGEIDIYASTEEQALELARTSTEYLVAGVDDTTWHVREPEASYAV